MKGEKWKTVGDKNDASSSANNNIAPALETRKSHTIEYDVTEIVPQRYRQSNKSPAVLRGSAARMLIIKCTDVQSQHRV